MSSRLVYVSLYNGDCGEEIITLLASEYLDAALRIPYFKDVYGTLNFRNERIGYSAECPVKFSYIYPDEFMHILKLLKLQNMYGGDAAAAHELFKDASTEMRMRFAYLCSRLCLGS